MKKLRPQLTTPRMLVRSLLWAGTLQLLFSASATCTELQNWPPAFVEDADLHSVTFADEQTVWAVGERGTMWKSSDAGATWTLQPAVTDQALHSIDFADPPEHKEGAHSPKGVGTAVGGGARMWGLPSLGTVLRTVDHGETWQAPKWQLLPALRKVQHSNPKSALAIGDAWALNPSGIFATSDTGRSWSGRPGRIRSGWATGDLSNPSHPLLVSDRGDVVALRRTTLTVPRDETHAIRDACWLADRIAMAVGDDAALMVSNDSAQTWMDLRPALPDGIAFQFDFHTLHVQGNKMWIAGAPGTIVFRSTDAGRHWQAVPTGQTLPIQSIHFAKDALHGVAVGHLGLRLFTTDGGAQWQSASEPQRTSALIFAARPEQIPLDLIAHLSLGHGLRCRVALFGSTEGRAPEQRLAVEEALRTVGADSLVELARFPVPPTECRFSADTVKRLWQRHNAIRDTAIHDTAGPTHRIDAWTQRIEREIRTWRPDLVAVATGAQDGAEQLFEAGVSEAVTNARSQTTRTASSAMVALAPWDAPCLIRTRVESLQRTSVVGPSNSDGPDARMGHIDLAEPLDTVASSVAARANVARAMLNLDLAAPTTYLSLHGRSITRLVPGIAAATQLPARRKTIAAPNENAPWLRRQAATHANVQVLLSRLVDHNQASAGTEQLTPLVKELDSDAQSLLLYSISRQFHRAGRTATALKTLDTILRREQKDANAFAAAMTQLRWSSSPEFAVLQRHLESSHPKSPRTIAHPTTGSHANRFATAIGQSSPPVTADSRVRRPPLSKQEFERLKSGLPPASQMAEWLRFTEAAARRKTVGTVDQNRIYERLRRTLPNGSWRRCATTESWLTDPKPKSQTTIPGSHYKLGQTTKPPHLDGRLDESLWSEAPVQRLTSVSAASVDPFPKSQIQLARDDRYLYIGIRCQYTAGPSVTRGTDSMRQRDTDLSAMDRVELMFDTNRDYSSGWRLCIDRRGWANDAFERDPSWNPQWYIAQSEDDSYWYIEAAIPWNAFVIDLPSHPIWLFGVRRISPGLGVAAWPPIDHPNQQWQHCGYLWVEPRGHRSL